MLPPTLREAGEDMVLLPKHFLCLLWRHASSGWEGEAGWAAATPACLAMGCLEGRLAAGFLRHTLCTPKEENISCGQVI